MIQTTLAPGYGWPGRDSATPENLKRDLAKTVMHYIRANPGASVQELSSRLSKEFTLGAVRSAVLRLRKAGRIQAHKADGTVRWVYYVKES